MRIETKSGSGIASKVDLVVTLKNTTPKLLRFDADLRATMNGKDLDAPVLFSSQIGPGEIKGLIVVFRNVPMEKVGGTAVRADGRLRYNVRYYFTSPRAARQTSKLVIWEGTASLTGKSGNNTEMEIFTRFADEIEE